MLGEEADGLVTSLDSLDHVPDGGVLPDEVGFSEFCDLVVSLTFGGLDDVPEVFVLQGIFSLVFVGAVVFFLVVVLIGAVLVDLWSAGNGISVHVVVELVLHFLLDD